MTTNKPATSHNGAVRSSNPVLHPSWYKFVSWHNLCTAQGPIRGDTYCLGKSESGKSTWLDGAHATHTCGHDEYMAWNSASDPTKTHTGRTLRDILLWHNDFGVQRPEGGIAYFALEYAADDGTQRYTVGFGARCRGAEHSIHRWGFILAKPLAEVEFVDPQTQDVLDEDPFAQRYGERNVFSVNEFRTVFAQRFYGAPPGAPNDARVREHVETIERFLDMGKSYTRLTKEGKDITGLIRKVLPNPNPEDYERARAQMERIVQFDSAITDLDRRRDDLEKLGEAVQGVRGVRYRLLRMDAFKIFHEVRVLEARIQALEKERIRLHDLCQTATQQSSVVGQRRDDLQRTLEALRNETDFRALQEERAQADALQRLLQEQKQLEKELADLDARLHDVRAQRDALQAKVASTIQTVVRKLSDLAFPKALVHLRSHLDAWREALAPLAQDPTHPLDALDAADRQWAEALGAEQARREASERQTRQQVEALQGEIDALGKQLADLDQRQDEPPIPGLLPVFDQVKDHALLLYRHVEPKPGREADARLLEAFLAGATLGAIIPLEADLTESVKVRVHARLPNVHVVERSEIPMNVQMAPGSILECIDETASDPRAYAYLGYLCADVALLDAGTPRGQRARVVWRDGTVYNHITWHLDRVPAHLESLGPQAARRRLERLRTELEAQVAAKESQRNDLAKALVAVRDLFTALHRIRDEQRAHQTQLQLGTSREVLIRHATSLEQLGTNRAGHLKRMDGHALILQGQRASLDELRAGIKAKGAREKAEQVQRLEDEKKKVDGEFEGWLKALGDHEGQIRETKRLLSEKDVERVKAREAEAAMRVKLLPLARQSGFDEATLSDYVKKHVEDQFEYEKLENTRRSTESEHVRTMSQVQAQVSELNRRMMLLYDTVANDVIDQSTKETLGQMVFNLGQQITAQTEQRWREVQKLGSQMVIRGIVDHMKRDLATMRNLVDEVNKQMVDHPWNGSTFRISDEVRKATDADPGGKDVERFHNLVKNFSLENQQEVVEFITAHLKETSVEPGRVPSLFNYKEWFSFSLIRRQGTKERGMTEFLEKASGGGRTVPHYILAFSLFKVLYDRIGSRIRTVLIDEAFRGADSASIDVLIGFAKAMGLDLIAANTELTGRTTAMDKSTVLMFTKDPKTHVTWIRPLTQEPLVPTR